MTAQPQRQIELLPREEWEKSSFGKFVKWALSVGRYIVIGTEMIVIAAFLSRFKLDRDLTNLYEEIKQKQAIVVANQDFEKEFRFLQTRLKLVQELQTDQQTQLELVDELASLIPVDVAFEDISIDNQKVKFTANALSEQGLASFIKNLESSKKFESLTLSDVSSGSKNKVGISFTVSGNLPSSSRKEPVTVDGVDRQEN